MKVYTDMTYRTGREIKKISSVSYETIFIFALNLFTILLLYYYRHFYIFIPYEYYIKQRY